MVGTDNFLKNVIAFVVQTNGFEFLLCTVIYFSMAVISSGTLLKTQRSKRFVEMLRKKRSTMFNQDAEVGVK